MKTFYQCFSFLITLLYYSIRILPHNLRVWVATHLPTWPDRFVPGGFFAPVNFIPPIFDGPIPKTPNGFVLKNVASPLSLVILAKKVVLRGTVTLVEHRPLDADWDHETFRIQVSPAILNLFSKLYLQGNDSTPHTGNSFTLNTIEVEPSVGAILPKVGDTVFVYGSFVINMANGYPELHPCYAIVDSLGNIIWQEHD